MHVQLIKTSISIMLGTIVVLISVNSCSYPLQMELHNGLDIPITVKNVRGKGKIESQTIAVVDYPNTAESWMLLLDIAGCEYAYLLPKSLEGIYFPSERGSLPAKLVSSLNLLLGRQLNSPLSGQLISPASRSCG